MSGPGEQGTDGTYGDGTWLPGGYVTGSADDDRGGGRRPAGNGSDERHRERGSTQTSQDRESQTGPPWEEASPPWDQPGWDDTTVSPPEFNPADLAGQHPSGPLPSQPLQEGDWPEFPPAFDYPGHEPGYPSDTGQAHGGYAGDRDDDTGYGYAGYADAGYDPGGYPEADYPAGHDDTGSGFPATGDVLADTGMGYAHPAYGGGQFTTDAGRYPEDGGYPAGDDAGYLEYGGTAGGPGDGDDEHGYPDHGGWHGDADDQRRWAEDDTGGFLPGMSTGARSSSEGRPGDRRPPGRGRRSANAGPGKQGTGRTSAGRARDGKRKSSMRRLAPWLALSVVLALVIGAGGGYFYVSRTYLHPPDFTGAGTGSLVVRVYQGDTASVVGQRLQRAGVVASARAFFNAAKDSGKGSALEPGYYRVHRQMSGALAFALLLKPSARMQTKITIPEGKRLSQIIVTLGSATGDPQGYQQAIKRVSALNLPPIAHGNPEGYLFPATYNVQPNTPPVKVLQEMVTRFGQEAASITLPAAAAHAELTQAQVIVVASLVQAEGRHLSDFPKIARVIYNRLNSSPQIPLQLDSTVMYALHRYGILANSQQIKVKSPYNTYANTGLPPGPIDSPGDAAIKAALHPAHGTWMYFVTVDPKTGLTKFTSSFAQFQQFRAQLTANLAKEN